jgi:ribose/xylose/arabinose/galactoside ABC-type transport system permease subunit
VGEISVKTGNNARNGGKNSLNRLIRCVCGKKSAQIREILISESAWEEMTCLFAPSLGSTSLLALLDYIGTLLGALSIAVIQNGLILSHISPFYTQIATGTIILLAIWLNTRILNPTRSAAKG